MQSPHSIIMVQPKSFGFNPETASSNVFQQQAENENVAQEALKEFNQTVKKLERAGISVKVFEDHPDIVVPDAVFPNNWFITQPDGKLILCPMSSEIRRKERRDDILQFLRKKYMVSETIDLTAYEEKNQFLEGTGSIVFDHIHKKAYACPSSRTDENLLNILCHKMGYKPVIFTSRDEKGTPIYHTNVLMSIGSTFAVVCLDAIHPADHEPLLQNLTEDNLKVISIGFMQMKAMAGNILEVQTKKGQPVLIMSETAFNSLLPGQVDALSQLIDIETVSIPTIEKVGGGGIRCMIAGVHLPTKD